MSLPTVGDRVESSFFGRGTVTHVMPSGEGEKRMVDWDDGQRTGMCWTEESTDFTILP